MSPGGRGHNAKVRLRALALREAGWSLRRTSEILRSEDMPVATSTILRWENPKVHEREVRRAAKRVAKIRAENRPPARGYTVEFRTARMRELYDRGVSLRGIGQVCAVWFGEELSEPQVLGRLGLERGQVVRRISERVEPEGRAA